MINKTKIIKNFQKSYTFYHSNKNSNKNIYKIFLIVRISMIIIKNIKLLKLWVLDSKELFLEYKIKKRISSMP